MRSLLSLLLCVSLSSCFGLSIRAGARHSSTILQQQRITTEQENHPKKWPIDEINYDKQAADYIVQSWQKEQSTYKKPPKKKGSAKLPKDRKQKPDKKQKKQLLLETHAHTDTDAKVHVDVHVDTKQELLQHMQVTGPVLTRGIGTAAGISPATARGQIRSGTVVVGAGHDDTDQFIDDFYIYEVAGPMFGRILSVAFGVDISVGFAPGAQAEQWCNAVFNPNGYAHAGPIVAGTWNILGAQNSRSSHIWQLGHIIGSSLGGHDDDPLNFFPQHRSSNTDGSVWWRAERIAARVQDTLDSIPAAIAAGCQTWVYINFVYPHPILGPLIPAGGTYDIRLDAACFAMLPPVVAAGPGATHAYLAAFQLNSVAMPIDPPIVNVRWGKIAGQSLEVNWRNQPDRALSQPPTNPAGGAVAMDVTHFNLVPQLFP